MYAKVVSARNDTMKWTANHSHPSPRVVFSVVSGSFLSTPWIKNENEAPRVMFMIEIGYAIYTHILLTLLLCKILNWR